MNPIDIRITTNTVETLRDLIDSVMRPTEYATNWPPGKCARYIESALVRIPLAPFWLNATNGHSITIVDGKQRYAALYTAMIALPDDWQFSGMEYMPELNGLSYNQLAPWLRRRIEETYITTYTIMRGTPPDVVDSLYRRINPLQYSMRARS